MIFCYLLATAILMFIIFEDIYLIIYQIFILFIHWGFLRFHLYFKSNCFFLQDCETLISFNILFYNFIFLKEIELVVVFKSKSLNSFFFFWRLKTIEIYFLKALKTSIWMKVLVELCCSWRLWRDFSWLFQPSALLAVFVLCPPMPFPHAFSSFVF